MPQSTMLRATRSLTIATAVLAAAALKPALAAPATIYDLGTLGYESYGAAVNSSGQVVGWSKIDNSGHAFLYSGTPGSGGAMYDLGTLGGSDSAAVAINASGLVVGSSFTAGNLGWHPFFYTGVPGRGGAMADQNPTSSRAYFDLFAINAAGQAVGNENGKAIIYTSAPGGGGTTADLGALPGFEQGAVERQPYGINAGGQVTGTNLRWGDGVYHAFLYSGTPGQGGAIADLGTLGGSRLSIGRAINDAGQVVGESGGRGREHAFLYSGTPGRGGAMADLGTLGGWASNATSINAGGQIVGWSDIDGGEEPQSHAFLYTGTPGSGGVMIDLDAWLDATNPTEGAKWTLTTASGLSDNGLITGTGLYSGDSRFESVDRAFLLDASALLPEPGGLALLALGGLALLRRRRHGAKQSATLGSPEWDQPWTAHPFSGAL